MMQFVQTQKGIIQKIIVTLTCIILLSTGLVLPATAADLQGSALEVVSINGIVLGQTVRGESAQMPTEAAIYQQAQPQPDKAWESFPDQHSVALDKEWNIAFSSDIHQEEVKYISLTKNNQLTPGSWILKGQMLTSTGFERYEADSIYKLTILLRNGNGYYLYFDTFNENAAQGQLQFRMQTPHFLFYTTEQDVEILPELATALETNFARVQTDLHTQMNGQQRIEIYPNQESYLQASSMYGWSAACATGGTVQANSLKTLQCSFDTYVNTLTHEITHNVEASLNAASTLPHWLNEGVACFEGKTNNNYATIARYVRQAPVPTFDELESNYYRWPELGGYELSYSIVEYYVQTYGYEKLHALISDYDCFAEITGITLEQFQATWLQAIQAKYVQ
ncbi:MAG: hypothetical protein LBT32_03595 [Peptococcaceae bacterium]|jgi:hypothetical protein|nr:hypothetical protein [Peptococcaceae bacterium]